MLRPLFFAALTFSASPTYAYNQFEKALSAYQNDEIEQAYIYLKSALQEDDEDIASKVLMGQVLLRKGLYADSIREFEEATYLGADQNQFIFDQVRAMLLIGRYRRLVDLLDYRQLRINSSVKAQTLLIKSNALLELDNELDALDALEQAYELEPDNISVLSSMASYHIRKGELHHANGLLKKLKALAPESARVVHLSGEYQTAMGENIEALSLYKKAHELSPNDPIIMRSLAHSLTSQNQFDEALSLINKVIEITPNDPYARLLKSQLLSQNNQLQEARTILQDISAKLSLLTDVEKNNNVSLAYLAGTSAYMQGNLELAQKELVFYLNNNPSDIAGLNLLSIVYEKLGQPEKIEDLLERHQKVVSSNLNLSLKLFEIYLASGKIYKARGILEDVEEAHKEDLRVVTARALFLAKAKRFDEALAALAINSTASDSVDITLIKGLIYLEMSNYSEAISIADKLLEISPDSKEFRNFKGMIYLRSSEPNKALKIFENIHIESPENFTYAFNLANAHANLKSFDEALAIVNKLINKGYEQNELLLLNAKLLRDSGSAKGAINVVSRVLERDNKNREALELSLSLLYEVQSYEKALDIVDELSNIEFLSPRHLIYRTNILIALNRIEETSRPLGVLLGLAQSAEDYYRVSQLQAKAGNYSSALDTLEKALAIAPDEKALKIEKLMLSVFVSSTEESQSYLTTLLKQYPNDAELSLVQGDISEKRGDLKKAETWYRKALAQNNSYNAAAAKLYGLANKGIGTDRLSKTLEDILSKGNGTLFMRNLLADHYINTHNYQLAKPHYEILVGHDLPNKANILNNLANIYIEEAPDKAASFISRAIALSPNTPSYLDTEAWIMVKQGRLEAALNQLRKAFTLSSDDPVISYHIGYTLNELGRKEEAIYELERALSSDQNFEERKSAESLLKAINMDG